MVSRLVVREKNGVTRILVQSDKGLVLFDGDLDHVLWNKPMYCPRDRCYSDLGSDGTVAVVIAGENVGDPYTVQTFAPDGSTLGSGSDPEQIGDVLNDIAVDPVNKQVSNWCLVACHVKYAQILIASHMDRGSHMIPCVFAFDYTVQQQKWHDFCVTEQEEVNAHKNTGIYIKRMHFSDFDNKLYVAANSHGGDMILLLNPLDIRNHNDSLAGVHDDSTVIHRYDHYSDTWGFHGRHMITYLARYEPSDGSLESASFIVPRRQSGSGCSSWRENEFVRVNELPGTGRVNAAIKQSALIVLEMPNNDPGLV
nr:hypothetical protein BaRGS_019543 [Batillaria attramentaria]